jgi:hypothetical protein
MTEIIETIGSLAQFDLGGKRIGVAMLNFPTDHRCW